MVCRNNQRTGRARLDDPNPPPPQTYLDNRHVRAHIAVLQATPNSREHVYRRPMLGILEFLFPQDKGYYVVQETTGDDTTADFTAFKVACRPGGTDYEYEFLLAESKRLGEPWGSTEDQCFRHCFGNTNDSKNVYAMVHIGLEVQFYKYENSNFSRVGGRMHLVNDVQAVTAQANYIRSHPMPFV